MGGSLKPRALPTLAKTASQATTALLTGGQFLSHRKPPAGRRATPTLRLPKTAEGEEARLLYPAHRQPPLRGCHCPSRSLWLSHRVWTKSLEKWLIERPPCERLCDRRALWREMATKDPPGQRFPPGRWRWTWERGGHGWRPAGGFSSVPTRCPERGGELRLSVTVIPGDAPVSWGTLRGSSELDTVCPLPPGDHNPSKPQRAV